MDTYHITMLSTSDATMDVTREALHIKDIIEVAFEEAFCDIHCIAKIDLEYIKN